MKLRVAVAPDTPVSDVESHPRRAGRGLHPGRGEPRRAAARVAHGGARHARDHSEDARVHRSRLRARRLRRLRRSREDVDREDKPGGTRRCESDAKVASSSCTSGSGAAEVEDGEREPRLVDASKFPPGLVFGEVPRAPRVTFDEHLFFSQDELDRCGSTTEKSFFQDSLKEASGDAGATRKNGPFFFVLHRLGAGAGACEARNDAREDRGKYREISARRTSTSYRKESTFVKRLGLRAGNEKLRARPRLRVILRPAPSSESSSSKHSSSVSSSYASSPDIAPIDSSSAPSSRTPSPPKYYGRS